MSTLTRARKPHSIVVQLCWQELDGTVMVTPQDEERFYLRVNRVIEILQREAKAGVVELQFNLLLRVLAEWLQKQDKVRTAFLTLRDGGLCLVLERNQVQFDPDFEDAVTELDIALAADQDLDALKVDILPLPLSSEEAIATFLSPDFQLKYVHGGSGRPDTACKQEP